jgi:DNA invertase Pin-like site-specific DNA recombinase
VRAAIYARISTPEQHIDTQLFDLRQLAQQRGYEVVSECVYTDVGSGTKARRPGLDALLKDARKRKFDIVLVAAFDRIARSTRHFLQVIDELEDQNIRFVSRRENIDTSGAMGRLFVTLIGSIAELEADLIRERIRAGMRRRKLEGYRLGRQPLDIDHAALVSDRLSGMSLTKTAKKYGVSRASVVRFCRLAQQRQAAEFTTMPIPEQQEHAAVECA